MSDFLHVHGCKLPADHRGGCLSDKPHQFGPDGCPNCKPKPAAGDR